MSISKEEYVFVPFKVTEVKCRTLESIPRPRSGHRIACDDSNVYCFGGYNPALPPSDVTRDSSWSPERPLFKELWSFNIAIKTWRNHNDIENMPEELASNAMCMNGRYLMIYGGTGAPFGSRCGNDLIVWRTEPGDARLQVANVHGSKPPGLYGQSVVSYDGYFYTIGGTNGFAYNSDIYRLDLRTLEWEPVFVGTGQEEEPVGRYRHEVARVDDKLYIIGGGTGDWAFELKEIPMFDLETRTWKILVSKSDGSLKEPLHPLPRKCHSAVQIDTEDDVYVYVAGGSDGQSVFNDIWRLSIKDMQWTLMQKTVLPHPLYFHSSAATSFGCMYVFGGIEPKEQSACRNNKLYKAWLCIPKLTEICWEAVTYYHPDLDKKDKSSLLDAGIPRHLVDRLLQ